MFVNCYLCVACTRKEEKGEFIISIVTYKFYYDSKSDSITLYSISYITSDMINLNLSDKF